MSRGHAITAKAITLPCRSADTNAPPPIPSCCSVLLLLTPRFCHQTDTLEAGSIQLAHDFHNFAVVDLFIAAHEDALVVSVLRDCVRGDLVVIAGGSRYKDPQTFSGELTDVIQVFDARTQNWTIAGRLPFRVKTCLAASYDGWLYVSGGQRDYGVDDPRPGAVESSTWRTKFFSRPRRESQL